MSKDNTGKKTGISMGQLVVAKIIAVAVFCFACILIFAELSSVVEVVIPYLSTYLLDMRGSDTVLASTSLMYIYWLFPMFFVIFLLVLFHFVVIKAILKKLWKWLVGVMKKNVSDKSIESD